MKPQLKEPYHVSVTEVTGAVVAEEQIQRVCNRYFWAGQYCAGKDVLEVSCGTGPGLGYLLTRARNFVAGDFSTGNIEMARAHYGERIRLHQFDAQNLPYRDSSFEVVVLLESIYFIPSAEQTIRECRRVLRDAGKVVITMANMDLYEFHRSNYAYQYFGVRELNELLTGMGFSTEFFGDTPVMELSVRQKISRPLKAIAAKSGIMPQTTRGKVLLRRLVFGPLQTMPAEIDSTTRPFIEPSPLSPNEPDRYHKVIFCVATKQG
jgi:SAM-dependent methyltransferase